MGRFRKERIGRTGKHLKIWCPLLTTFLISLLSGALIGLFGGSLLGLHLGRKKANREAYNLGYSEACRDSIDMRKLSDDP